tara:strand:- start:611 stop:946 length:336 start_codon:yes stop_codon:yes gene_type:complete
MIKVTYINRQGELSHDKYFHGHYDALAYLLKEAKNNGYYYKKDCLQGLLGTFKRPYKSAYSTIICNVYNREMIKAPQCIAFPYEVVYIPKPIESADMQASELFKLVQEVSE